MVVVDQIEDVVGKVICERPYVKVLSMPRKELVGIVPDGLPFHEQWIAVAQVEGTITLVELKVSKHG